jgi:PEP-CTERM motif
MRTHLFFNQEMDIMNFKSFGIFTSFFAGALVIGSAPAQAFGTFSFTTNSTYQVGQEKNDIMLQSVTQDGKTVNKFNMITSANIRQQNEKTIDGYVNGLLSTNCGDNVANCVSAELPSNAQVVSALGNLNLNKIVDSEEFLGSAVLDVFFEKPSDSFYLFERGGGFGSQDRAGNSDLKVQAIDAQGNLLGETFTIGKNMWTNAGYAIDTKEIGAGQKVGSFGLTTKNGLIAGLRLTTNSTGADFKVIAATTKVPEPATMLGFAIVGGAMTMVRRRKTAQ